MFEVLSSNGQATYQVRVAANGAWICSCPSWRFSHAPGNRRQCKHIRQLASQLVGHLEHSH
jgi:predicted nucleic acid-binding Zn finger protein